MDKDPTKRHRASAVELALEARLFALTQTLQMFAHRVYANLPNVGQLDLSMLSNIPSVESGHVTDQAMIDGHGPRFVAKYHLAGSDEERRRLLETLPQVGGYDSGLIWANLAQLTADGRIGFDESHAHPKWTAMYEETMARTDLLEVVDGTFYDLASVVVPEVINGTPLITDGFWCVKYKTSETERKDGYHDTVKVPATEKLFALLGIAELGVLVLVSHTRVTYNRDQARITPRYEGCLWWNYHEQCWNLTSVNFDSSWQETITRRYLKCTGMPDYDHVTLDELAKMGDDLLTHLRANEDWYKAAHTYSSGTKKTTVTLPNVLSLRFQRSAYGEGDVMLPIFTGALYPGEWPIAYEFPNEWKTLPLYGKDQYGHVKASLPILPYARREVMNAIYQFINADPSQLVIEHEKYDEHDDDD